MSGRAWIGCQGGGWPAHLPTRLICLLEILVPLISSRSTAAQSCCEERSMMAVSLPIADWLATGRGL